jgi:pyrimidine-specific ribonucleoside hydrolase
MLGMRAASVLLALALALATALGGCTNATRPAPSAPSLGSQGSSSALPRSVVIDTDMAPDDWLAILFLLGRPDVNVVAITVSGTGEAHCGPGVQNAIALIAVAGKTNIPVACGRETPLAGTHAFPEEWRARVDGHLGIPLATEPGNPSRGSAFDLMASTLRASPEMTVTVLTLGPLTNLADVLQQMPELRDRIGATYIMGGAVDVGGNVGASGVGIDNTTAEWNVYIDPVAAKAVLDAGIRATLIPLDATNHAPVSAAFAARLAGDSGTPAAKFASDVLTQLRDSIATGYSFWDPFAAAVLVDESLTTFESRGLSVVVDEGPESGRVIASAGAPATRFATSADLGRLETLLIDTLNRRTR